MTETAGTWIRVSTGPQDETNQLEDIKPYVTAHGYDVVKRYVLNDISAFKGEQDAMLAEMLNDIRTGVIKVLVIWHSDRLERRGPEALFRALRLAREAGGRVESVKEPMLGLPDMSGEALTAISAISAHAESVHKSERVTASFDNLTGNGYHIGRAPYGYRITGERLARKLEASEWGEEFIPQVFQRVADGESLSTVAEFLGDGFWPRTVGEIIRNETYKGRRHQRGAVLTVTALVSPTLWRLANDRLDNAPRGRRGPRKGNAPAFLTSLLFCGECASRGIESPMYRIIGGRVTSRTHYYRCSGRGAQRKGCGNMLLLADADALVRQWIATASSPWVERKPVPADDHNDAIEYTRSQIDDLSKAFGAGGMDAVSFAAKMGKLASELVRLRSLPVTAARTETVETGETIAEHLLGLSLPELRKALMSYVRFYARQSGTLEISEPGTLAPRAEIDDVGSVPDGGVWVSMPA